MSAPSLRYRSQMKTIWTAMTALAVASTSDSPLDALRWERRLLVVLAPSADDTRISEQLSLLAAASAGAAERQLTTAVLWPGGGHLDGELLSATEAEAAWAQLRAHGPFAVLLIGKDGAIKSRTPHPTDMAPLFELIDSMPMRQREPAPRAST